MHPGDPWVPAVITSRLGPVTYMVRTSDGRVWKRHIEQLIMKELVVPFESELPSLTQDDLQDLVASHIIKPLKTFPFSRSAIASDPCKRGWI